MRFQWLTSAVLVVMFTLGGCGDPARTSNTRTETPEVPATREAPKNTTVPMGTGAMALSADGLFKLHIPPNGFSDVVVVSIQKQPEAPTSAIGVTPSYRVTWSPKSATITPSTPATDTQAAVNIEFSAYYFMSPEEVETTGEANLAQGFDEQEAATGCQARNLRFNGGVTGGEGRDRAVLADADDVITFGHCPCGGKASRVFNIREHVAENAAVLRVKVHSGAVTDADLGAPRQAGDHRHVVGFTDEDGMAGAVEGFGFNGSDLVGRQHLHAQGVRDIGER